MAPIKKSATLNSMAKKYSDETKARELLESLRWPSGVACPRCRSIEVVALAGARPGLYRCHDCREHKTKDQFTVTVGTIFEDSHIPLSKWLLAITLMCSSKKGMSAHQLHRMLGITYKSAWFMAHRIRYAMEQSTSEKLGGIIEADETWVGGKATRAGNQTAWENKSPVLALVQRNGEVRTRVVPTVSAATLKEFLLENAKTSARLMTDELDAYEGVGKQFKSHERVKHKIHEYSRGDVTTNSAEGFFSILKRGINGVYHHVSKEHLHRYLSEFDFRYNRRKITDDERTISAIAGFDGKRLKYRDSLA